jgi:hypothetical protein
MTGFKRRTSAILLFFLLLAASAGEIGALTLYVRRVIVMDPGVFPVSSLVQPMGDTTPWNLEALRRGMGVLSDTPILVPCSLYRGFFEDGGPEGLILVGKRTLVIPSGALSVQEVVILDRLVDFMEALGGIGAGKVGFQDIRLAGAPSSSFSPECVSFQLIRAEKNGGLFCGAADFGFKIAFADGGKTSGHITLKVIQDVQAQSRDGPSVAPAGSMRAVSEAPTEAPVVKANDQVTVFFRRGSISVEMAGKAQSTALEGGNVSVYMPDTRMSFSGIAIGEKAVSVELP